VFGLRRACEQGAERAGAFARRPFAGDLRHGRKSRIHVSNFQRRPVSRWDVRRGRNCRVSDADPALPGRAREKRHSRLDLVRLEPREQVSEPVDFVQPAARAGDIGRRGHEVHEAHDGDRNVWSG
jgi:hypothetical protein